MLRLMNMLISYMEWMILLFLKYFLLLRCGYRMVFSTNVNLIAGEFIELVVVDTPLLAMVNNSLCQYEGEIELSYHQIFRLNLSDRATMACSNKIFNVAQFIN